MNITQLRIGCLTAFIMLGSGCGVPTEDAASSGSISPTTSNTRPTDSSNGASAMGTGQAQETAGNKGGSSEDAAKVPAAASGSDSPSGNRKVPVESNAVILTGTGLMPAGGQSGQFATSFFVENTSSQSLAVLSVDVINDVGSAFSLGGTTCLNFLLTPAKGGGCVVFVEDSGQAVTDRGRLVLTMSDNTAKAAQLPLSSARRGTVPAQQPTASNGIASSPTDPLPPTSSTSTVPNTKSPPTSSPQPSVSAGKLAH